MTQEPVFNPVFADYAQRIAFNLTLSRNQITSLAMVAIYDKGVQWPGDRSRQNPDLFIPGVRGLESRGLIEHNKAWALSAAEQVNADLSWVFRLTQAGEHVHALLKIAGVLPQLQVRNKAA